MLNYWQQISLFDIARFVGLNKKTRKALQGATIFVQTKHKELNYIEVMPDVQYTPPIYKT